MFLHFYARFISMHNESIYERTNIFESHKPLHMRKFMDLLDELLILNVHGTEDDSDEESEDESQLQESIELNHANQKTSSLQHVDNSTPKGRRCSRRPRSQRIEKASSSSVGKKGIKNSRRNCTTKKVKGNTLPATHSETSTSSGDSKEPRIKREDPYLLWLTAVMLKKVDRCDEAIELLVRALRLQPCHWGAWIELATLIKDLKMVIITR